MLYLLAILFVPAALTAKCCGPAKFSATMYVVGTTLPANGVPNLFEYDLRLFYDYNGKMARTQMEIAGKEQISLLDLSKNISYNLYDGHCTMENTTQQAQSPCVPDEAQLVGHQMMGSANYSLAVDTWRWATSDLTIKFTVTNDTCTIVQMSMYGNIGGSPGETTYLLSDITEGALPNGIFNIPPECRSHENGAGPVVG
ncbi:uncharacterized protein LOC132543959 [Ylistrum balloti]|uniref:uncharacterized protein LOC132543959 n=1 Tax=Ylistrum balloti TaxID=509963 RepID=UPI002905E2C5|nr:uncharacterized protein LOC132543959 [Ylistrum balloti]